MFKDKYPSIFSPQMGAIVFIILQIFFATRAIFKIGEYLRVSAYKNRPKSPINGTSQKIDFACILPIERS